MSSSQSPDSASVLQAAPSAAAPASGPALARRYARVRAFSRLVCTPLAPEDYGLQAMPDVSPTKWHLAHTTWFFETFLLKDFVPGYRVFHPDFVVLYNSYYNAVGEQFTRAHRGFLSRPSVDEVQAYRAHVDERVEALLESADAAQLARMRPILEIGLQHEQQHQELMLTDIKYNFSVNPLQPVYQAREDSDETMPRASSNAPAWRRFEAGIHVVGHPGARSGADATSGTGSNPVAGFAFDNESPRHRVFLEPFELATRLVTAGEYLAFMEDGGYSRPELWLSEGWATVQREGWEAPLYWRRAVGATGEAAGKEDEEGEARNGGEHDRTSAYAADGSRGWLQFTLSGLRPVDPHEPVCHVSLFEADAFARWSGARLPTEFEWEAAAQTMPIKGNFADDLNFHPVPLGSGTEASHTGSGPESGAQDVGATNGTLDRPPTIHQIFGDVWEWTSSSYGPYPGYAPPDGALGEYNGKFMYNQYVLRGGSCATSRDHIRASYRNFFPGHARWQFMGIRLARSVTGESV